MNNYFLDTSFIIAYMIGSDNQHHKTESLENIILNNDCCINNSVLNECVSVSFNKSKDLDISQEVYYILVDNFKIIDEYEILNFNDKTMDIFTKHEGKLSFTDSGIITTMVENEIECLLTFDNQFKYEDSIRVIGV